MAAAEANPHPARLWLALRNAALYAKLGLTPEQISKYEDVVTNHFLQDAGHRRVGPVAEDAADRIP